MNLRTQNTAHRAHAQHESIFILHNISAEMVFAGIAAMLLHGPLWAQPAQFQRAFHRILRTQPQIV